MAPPAPEDAGRSPLPTSRRGTPLAPRITMDTCGYNACGRIRTFELNRNPGPELRAWDGSRPDRDRRPPGYEEARASWKPLGDFLDEFVTQAGLEPGRAPELLTHGFANAEGYNAHQVQIGPLVFGSIENLATGRAWNTLGLTAGVGAGWTSMHCRAIPKLGNTADDVVNGMGFDVGTPGADPVPGGNLLSGVASVTTNSSGVIICVGANTSAGIGYPTGISYAFPRPPGELDLVEALGGGHNYLIP